MDEIKEWNKWRDFPCSRIRRLNIAKMSVLHILIYRFNAIPVKTSESYFMDTDKLILKFIWRGKKPRIANTKLKENKLEGLILPDFKLASKTAVIRQHGIGERVDR